MNSKIRRNPKTQRMRYMKQYSIENDQYAVRVDILVGIKQYCVIALCGYKKPWELARLRKTMTNRLWRYICNVAPVATKKGLFTKLATPKGAEWLKDDSSERAVKLVKRGNRV